MKKITLDSVKVLLTILGTLLVAFNVLPETQVDMLIGAIAALIGAIWTIVDGQKHATAEAALKAAHEELTAMKAGKVDPK